MGLRNNFKLIHGDCVTELKKLSCSGVKVDLILTDPPYGTTANRWDNLLNFKDIYIYIS